MQQIAILGTGAMGARLAQNLMQAGYAVTVYNRTRARAQPLIDEGATYATTPRAAAEGAELVISTVRDDTASQQVWLGEDAGAVHGLRASAIAVESSTLTVQWTQSLATAMANQGQSFLAVPVVGSRPQAEAKRLIGLAGGESSTLAAVQPVLTQAGIAALHAVGTAAQAMALKLAVNVLFGTQVVALAEMLTLLAKAELPVNLAMALLAQMPVTSPALQGAGALMVQRQHAPLFPIELVEKDFRCAIAVAALPACTAVGDIYRQAIEQGYGNDNITGILQLFAES